MKDKKVQFWVTQAVNLITVALVVFLIAFTISRVQNNVNYWQNQAYIAQQEQLELALEITSDLYDEQLHVMEDFLQYVIDNEPTVVINETVEGVDYRQLMDDVDDAIWYVQYYYTRDTQPTLPFEEWLEDRNPELYARFEQYLDIYYNLD